MVGSPLLVTSGCQVSLGGGGESQAHRDKETSGARSPLWQDPCCQSHPDAWHLLVRDRSLRCGGEGEPFSWPLAISRDPSQFVLQVLLGLPGVVGGPPVRSE